MLHSDFLPQTLLPEVLVLGSREQAGHCAQGLRSVATASDRPFLGVGLAGLGAKTLGCPFSALGAVLDPHSQVSTEGPGRSRGSCPTPHQNATA